MDMQEESKSIGEIGNYYGGLEVKTENGKYYWGVGDFDGTNWQEIPESLYRALLEYEKSRPVPID